ncbi:LamB/YcsF family protein [Rhodobacteraceae bacterium N5(2021)]|uniref:5-oxoprolinase subunit A n=1 Tax=Gymnodinialimonas phycosphaerae TaxID=2841589 RepID=A0A975TXV0_9RHOB|nr:5-oxoprolinase subunit PxpA [Gymnodinialimonas phycosphaerae]MBY4892664.1 LamB/YcsF family protein [Gymnodinialimonas phycosphaerae]
MARSIDLNSDLGEGFGPWSMGDDAAMLQIVTSANIACGGHASDPETMFETLLAARENGVVVGAHPGYNDREGFGRRVIPMAPAEIMRLVAAQIGALQGVAALAGTKVGYVKAHGALANLSARDRSVADALIGAVRLIDPALPILAISGTQTEQAARAARQPVFSEVFADRGYLSSGQLVPRGQDGAMIHDAEFAADRLLELLETGHMPVIDGAPIALQADSICVHGDSPGAVAMAAKIRARLEGKGFEIKRFLAL